jgi:hypothetical protein
MMATHGGHDALAAILLLNHHAPGNKWGIRSGQSRQLLIASTSLLDLGRAFARPFFHLFNDFLHLHNVLPQMQNVCA